MIDLSGIRYDLDPDGSWYAVQLRAIDALSSSARHALADEALTALELGPVQDLAAAGAERIRIEFPTVRRSRGHTHVVTRWTQDGRDRIEEARGLGPALRRAQRTARRLCVDATSDETAQCGPEV